MYKICQDGWPAKVFKTERQYKYWLKIIKGRKQAFGAEYRTYRLVDADSDTWEEFSA